MNTDMSRLTRAANATVVAEAMFVRPDGDLHAVTVTPLVSDASVIIALPYAHRELAEDLAAAAQFALVLSDDRMTLRGWEPLTVRAKIEVEHDLDGDRFNDGLVDQELRKHPPSRVLLDSLRDRHDHWWYVPRLLCHVVPTAPVQALTSRSDPTSGVLARSTADGLTIDTVEVVDADTDHLEVRSLSDREVAGDGEPALLFRHDYSQPDLERRSERHEAGRLYGTELRDVVRTGDLVLPEPPSLRERIRSHRALSKGCRRELARMR